MTPLSAIADMADGLPVICIEGMVKYASDVSSGKSKTGTEWSRQFFVLAQNGAEVGCTLWDAAGNEVKKGEQLRFENTQNKKKQWSAITKQSYEKDGKTNHTLEIRAEQAKIKPSRGGNSNRGEQMTDEPPPQTMSGQNEYGPRGNLIQIDQRDIPSSGVNEARQHIMQSVNLYNLCVDAVDNCVKPHVEGMTAEFYQAAVGTLFIEASRAGLVGKMPTKPMSVHNGNEKVERLPNNQEESFVPPDDRYDTAYGKPPF